ncbi:PREDICTED: parvalbumin beta-like [Thamnophis sirtalis]|uniref:Parvalbumin n=1 Tax=Thamnophis sirtalis TaxID=35019 RepID=A0A6I9XQ23_9SAUR|nr:PREDICTED: parvalbumin beta-like [Thamnophis sirtalis]
MAFAGILTDADIAAGLQSCKAADTFSCKTFFSKSGLHTKSRDQLAKVFGVLDQDKSGYIEEDELRVKSSKVSASNVYFTPTDMIGTAKSDAGFTQFTIICFSDRSELQGYRFLTSLHTYKVTEFVVLVTKG